MTIDVDDLPTDPEALRALLIAERAQHAAELARIASEQERLRAIIAALQRNRFGRRSEQLDPDQLGLALEDLEQAVAAAAAREEQAAVPAAKPAGAPTPGQPRSLADASAADRGGHRCR